MKNVFGILASTFRTGESFLQVILKFPLEILKGLTDVLFLALLSRFINDSSASCRKAISETIKLIFRKVRLFSMLLKNTMYYLYGAVIQPLVVRKLIPSWWVETTCILDKIFCAFSNLIVFMVGLKRRVLSFYCRWTLKCKTRWQITVWIGCPALLTPA